MSGECLEGRKIDSFNDMDNCSPYGIQRFSSGHFYRFPLLRFDDIAVNFARTSATSCSEE